MSGFDIQKGDVLWTLWADLFLFWKEYGNVKTQADADEFYKASVILDTQYRNTDEKDLCRAVIAILGQVADSRMIEARKKGET